MKTTLLAAVVTGLAGSAALAGSPEPYIEHVYMEPAHVVHHDTQWHGFYGGFVGGTQGGTIDPGAIATFDALHGGVFGGYNFQKDKVVFGGEIAAQMGSIDFTPGPAGDLEMLVDAKVRVGYSLGDALLFASGGYSTLGTNLLFGSNGWNAGAGLDYAINENFFVGGEYVYRNMPNTVPAGFSATSHSGQLRAGIKF